MAPHGNVSNSYPELCTTIPPCMWNYVKQGHSRPIALTARCALKHTQDFWTFGDILRTTSEIKERKRAKREISVARREKGKNLTRVRQNARDHKSWETSPSQVCPSTHLV